MRQKKNPKGTLISRYHLLPMREHQNSSSKGVFTGQKRARSQGTQILWCLDSIWNLLGLARDYKVKGGWKTICEVTHSSSGEQPFLGALTRELTGQGRKNKKQKNR